MLLIWSPGSKRCNRRVKTASYWCLEIEICDGIRKRSGLLRISVTLDKRPKMGLNRSPDIHWCHEQEYVLEDWVKTLANSVETSLY